MSDKEKVEVRIILPATALDEDYEERDEEQFEPEFVQGLFHSAQTKERGLGRNEKYVAQEMYALSEALAKMNPDEQRHGALGGEYGYGQDFKNEVFEMFPFYWGDCTCGYDEAEHEWSDTHVHAQECFHECYKKEETRVVEETTERSPDAWNTRHDHMVEWSKAKGYEQAPNGMAVYCDCPYDKAWHEWWTTHSHAPECPIIRPNFKYGDIEICWYKWIGRSMTVSRSVTRDEMRTVFQKCFESLKVKT